MKFKRNMFIELSEQKILSTEFSKFIILNKVSNIACGNTFYRDAHNIKDFGAHIKNKNLYVLVEGETIYIKMVTLPTVKKHQINDMIKNELRYYYKDIDAIAFTYKLIKIDKLNMDILVFCLKGNNLDILENSFDNNINLKKVNLVQFCFKNFYSDKINEKNYILVFYYNCCLYFLICNNGEIVANNIISDKEMLLLKFSYLMNEFLEQYKDYEKLCKKIYYANVEDLNIDELTYLSLPYKILPELKREELLKYIIIKG